MIRRATWEDIPDLVAVAENMVNESPEWGDFDEESMSRTLRNVFRGGGAAFVAKAPGLPAPIGAAVAFLTTRPFSGERFVADLAIWVRPEKRGSLLGAKLVSTLEAWAREEEAVEIQLGVSSGIHPDRTGALYESLGYRASGLVFVKKL